MEVTEHNNITCNVWLSRIVLFHVFVLVWFIDFIQIHGVKMKLSRALVLNLPNAGTL